MRRYRVALVGLAAIVAVPLGLKLWGDHGSYGANVLLRRGGTYWTEMSPADPRLPPAMRTALELPVPEAMPGRPRWRELAPGFETGELPVIVKGREVDRILLSRIDSKRYRFVVRNDPGGTKGIDEWEAALPGAMLIVNASYYDPRGAPDTPVVSETKPLGPVRYDARAGAFVDRGGSADVVDLADGDWRGAFATARNAMVSYPLLVGEDGVSHVRSRSRWLANRTFVARTRDGRIIVGTTREAFFSLDRLGDFLASAPLGISIALNLDGGPIACQSVRAGGYHRLFHARWEAQVEGNKVRLLRWPFESATWAMPMILAVQPR